MGLAELTKSKKWKNFMAKLYGLGATVVILGAMFKIQHWPGAGPMLVTGLTVEALIFFFSAFEPIHEEVDWSLVYPELAGMHGDEEGEEGGHEALAHGNSRDKGRNLGGGYGGGDSVSQELDRMLEEAKIGPELIESLGNGMRSLGENAAKLVNISDASVATNSYTETLNFAATSVNQFASSSARAADAMGTFATSTEDVQEYNSQIQSASKKLSELNALYDLQLRDTNVQLKVATKFHEGINEMVSNLNASVEQTAKYRDEITMLSRNLAALNTVYGNMLSAMTITKGA